MQQELKRYSARTHAEGRLPIQVQVGVNTGEVVVGTSISSIAATEQVRKLCEGYFAFAVLGPTKVKGVSEPVNVYEVTGSGRSALDSSAPRAAATRSS
jgi:class 3 adenylate cyclase